MIRPPYLSEGDEVRFVAPAKYEPREVIEPARQLVEEWGVHVTFGEHLFDQWHQFAAADEYRRYDLQAALDDDHVKAIF